jgi:hypothetical protein
VSTNDIKASPGTPVTVTGGTWAGNTGTVEHVNKTGSAQVRLDAILGLPGKIVTIQQADLELAAQPEPRAGYVPAFGDRVRVRRYEQPSLRPGDPDRKLLIELTGTITYASRVTIDLDPATVVITVNETGHDDPLGAMWRVGLRYVFLGSTGQTVPRATADADGRNWYLVTEVTPAPANAYEAAIERMEAATANHRRTLVTAERMIHKAADEYDAAEADLRQYESSPGVPLPRYRVHTVALAHDGYVPHSHELGSAATHDGVALSAPLT